MIVRLSNTGGQDTIFTVNGGAGIPVGPGGSTDVFVQAAEDADYSIFVSADGWWSTNFTGFRDCESPPDPPLPPEP